MKENAEKIALESFSTCVAVGTSLKTEETPVDNISQANELLNNLSKGDGLNFTKNPTLEGFIDFEFNNMYDGCIVPLFDTFGINNPCPNNEERQVLSQRILNEADAQATISADMSDAMIEWIDECGAHQECYEAGTGWSFVWAWNASWCIIMGFNFFFLAVGGFCWWPRLIASLFNIFLSCCHLSGAVFMLVGVYNPFSRVC